MSLINRWVIELADLMLFKMAAKEHHLPFVAEHYQNSGGEKLVRIWIHLNHAAYAETFVTPDFKQKRELFKQTNIKRPHMANKSLIDIELLQAFQSNTLAQQFATFHKLEFVNGSWMKIHFPDDGEVNNVEVTAILITVEDGDIKARNLLYGIPGQAYERAAYLANEYAKTNNTSVVIGNKESVDDKA